MLGWRAKIGWIRPHRTYIHANAHEKEKLLPEGVIFQDTYLDGPKTLSPQDLRGVQSQIEPLARELACIEPDVIIQEGVPITIVDGIGADKKIIDLIQRTTGVPATTSITSVVKAFQMLNMKKIVVIAPYYAKEVGEMVRSFLEGSGFNIVSLVSREGMDMTKMSEISQQQTYRLAKSAFLKAPSADGVFLVGAMPTAEIVEVLETDLGKPVISHTFAAIWDVLNMARVRQPIRGYGRLLTLF